MVNDTKISGIGNVSMAMMYGPHATCDFIRFGVNSPDADQEKVRATPSKLSNAARCSIDAGSNETNGPH